jgi:hypothetical protein
MNNEENSEPANVHPSIFPVLFSLRKYKKINKYLAQFGLTKSQRKHVIRQLKNSGPNSIEEGNKIHDHN